jgi:hypothetical protein
MTWTNSRAQRSRRSVSSGAETLNRSTSRPFAAAASALKASAGASIRKNPILRVWIEHDDLLVFSLLTKMSPVPWPIRLRVRQRGEW